MTIIEVLVQLRNDLKLWVANNLRMKVDKEDGKGLSSNDFTTEEKEKLAGLSTEGLATTVYVDEQLETKANTSHTHSQYLVASDIANFATTSYVDSGLETKANTVHAHDEYLQASDIADFVDKSYVDGELAKKSGKEHTHDEYLEQEDIADLATQEYVTTKIAEAKLAASDVDLSGYYTKSQTDAKIDTAMSGTLEQAKAYSDEQLDDAVSVLEVELDRKANKLDENDAMELIAEMGLIDPVADENGAVYTDENGVIYTL